METIKIPRVNMEWCNNCQLEIEARIIPKKVANRIYKGYVCTICGTFMIFRENKNDKT